MRLRGYAFVIALYAAALAVAVLGVDFGHHWDELKLLNSASETVRSGLLLPRWYNYPSLSYDLALAALVPESMQIASTSEPERARLIDEVATERIFQKAFRLRVRTLFAAVALLAILWTYAWAFAASTSVWEGLAASALLACSWELGYHARWIAPDAILAQFAAATMAALACASRSTPPSSRRWLVAAAVLAGFGCSSKYPGGMLLAPVLITSLQIRGRRACEHLGLVLIFAFAFVFTSPGILLEPGRSLADVQFEIEHYARGHGGYSVAPGVEHAWLLGRYLALEVFSPWPALAAALFSLAVLGGARLVLTDRRSAVAKVSVVVPYVLYMCAQRVMIVRNYLLLAPFLAFLAARGASWVVSATPRPLRALPAAALVAALAANATWQIQAARAVGPNAERPAAAHVLAFVADRPQRLFLLSQSVKRLFDATAAAAVAPNVVDTSARADTYLFMSTDVTDWETWVANRAGTYQLVAGPQDVNFDYYPTWQGAVRLLATPIETARAMRLVDPTPGSPSPALR